MIMDGQLRDLIKEFNNTVDAYFGVYLDSAHGFELVKKEIEEAQKKLIQINKKRKKRIQAKYIMKQLKILIPQL